MPVTLKHAISYPTGSQSPNVPLVIQQTAESVESALNKAAGLKHAEYTGPVVTSTAGAGANFGTLTVDNSQTVGNTFSTGGSNGTINMTEAGVYLITAVILPAANPGNVHMWAMLGSDTVASEGQITYGSNVHTISFSVRLLVGSTLSLGTTTANTVSIGSRVKITKIQNA